MPYLVHSAQTATAVNLCFSVAAPLCAFGLPRRLTDQQGVQDAAEGSSDRGGAPARQGRPEAA